ncbi:MAG TPA: DUF4124 domain-containing protein [Gammaproteobacteria bacterium]|nr:DUF4124 domain-containing protein [Gammaproteobacteria bacterium]
MNTFRYLLGFVLLLAMATASAGVYRWLGTDGVIHYSDTPPPKGAKLLSIESEPTDPAAVKVRDQARQKRIETYRQQRESEAAAAAKAEGEAAQAAKRCAAAKARVQSLEGINRVRKHGADGKTTYLSGADLVKFKQQERDKVAKLCAAAEV